MWGSVRPDWVGSCYHPCCSFSLCHIPNNSFWPGTLVQYCRCGTAVPTPEGWSYCGNDEEWGRSVKPMHYGFALFHIILLRCFLVTLTRGRSLSAFGTWSISSPGAPYLVSSAGLLPKWLWLLLSVRHRFVFLGTLLSKNFLYASRVPT